MKRDEMLLICVLKKVDLFPIDGHFLWQAFASTCCMLYRISQQSHFSSSSRFFSFQFCLYYGLWDNLSDTKNGTPEEKQ